MPTYRVIRKIDNKTVYAYTADTAIEFPNLLFAEFQHIEEVNINPDGSINAENSDWRIYVGSFFDRFGAYKLSILASADPLVQALIKDATVREYIDLVSRRAELEQMIGLLQSKGFAVDILAILDTPPTADEVYRG